MNLTIMPRMNNNLKQRNKNVQKTTFGSGHIPCLDVRQIRAKIPATKLPAFEQAQLQAKRVVSSVPRFLKSDPTNSEQILALKNLQSFFAEIQSGEKFKGLSMKDRVALIRDAISERIEELKI